MSDPVDVVVVGYASIDFAYRASAPPAVGRTAILRGQVVVPPRFGGCGPNAARAMARLGCRPGLVTWLGDDADGVAYLDMLAGEGIETSGVVVAPGAASPRALLFYDPDGGAVCYYHPSASATLRLTDAARRHLGTAKALALTVAPSALTTDLLDARPPGLPVAWNVKADPHAYPPPLLVRLVREAAVVCLNRGELPFVATALPADSRPARRPARHEPPAPANDRALAIAIQEASGGIVVVTTGAEGSQVFWTGGVATVPAMPVQVVDPTGAGDAFFGAFVAAWTGGAAPVAAAEAAAAAAAAMLRRRAEEESG